MMEFLEFTFKSFWHFVGVAILLNGAAYFIINGLLKSWSRLLRCVMVSKHGWPPSHLDADGDWNDAENLGD